MKYKQLGNSDIKTSLICLGTMTFGEQNTETDAHQQMDMATDYGINFFDTAELYSIPPKAETYGLTEQYIGSWFKKRARRDDIVLASKVAGPGAGWVDHIRGGPRLNREHMTRALEASLRRLQTEYIDLYQIHWPERTTNFFGKLGYQHADDETVTGIEETLSVLNDFVRAGKVRQLGISNETPWGVMQYLKLADKYDWPRIVSIQNPYNLLNRSFEVGLSEIAIREKTGLLAYSPLGFGVLSGKYLKQKQPANARLTLFPDYSRYSNENGIAATAAYAELARENAISPAQLALAFVNQQSFTTANIIGATTLDQLKENIESIDIQLSDDILRQVELIHSRYTIPCP
ncbi:MAG: NADP(H)-dependent aldo-keto reductase [Gammaproteobacteria bacterium]|nr:NADP(H)-dependent aldo-keto reductase [Gammaproteobacteria bacterium]